MYISRKDNELIQSGYSVMVLQQLTEHYFPPMLCTKLNTYMPNGEKMHLLELVLTEARQAGSMVSVFMIIIVSYFKRLEGAKIILGDNLSTHSSIEATQLCHKNGIRMIFLPANATHITQPLDVAFFRPLKENWRKVLI